MARAALDQSAKPAESLAIEPPDGDEPARDDWMSTIGMFDDDPVMAEIIEAGRQIREEDRKKACASGRWT